jgi:hypothetical protein
MGLFFVVHKRLFRNNKMPLGTMRKDCYSENKSETPTRRELSLGEAIWRWIDQPTNGPTDKVSYRGAMLVPKNSLLQIVLEE